MAGHPGGALEGLRTVRAFVRVRMQGGRGALRSLKSAGLLARRALERARRRRVGVHAAAADDKGAAVAGAIGRLWSRLKSWSTGL